MKKSITAEMIEKMINDNGFIEFLICALFEDKEQHKLKYSEDELEAIERKIIEKFPEGHQPKPTTLIPFGFYLGQLIIKKIPGAKWCPTDDDDIFEVSVEFTDNEGNTMKVKPFIRAMKFWKKREDRMSSFLRMICFNSEIKLDEEYWSMRADEDGWITMAWGDMFRYFKQEITDKDFRNAKGVFHNGAFDNGK